jgi:hypothetical protein
VKNKYVFLSVKSVDEWYMCEISRRNFGVLGMGER